MDDFELVPTDEERALVHGWERRPGSVKLGKFRAGLDSGERKQWQIVDERVQRGGIAHAIDDLFEEAHVDAASHRVVGAMSPVHPNDSIALGQVGKWRRLRDITNALPEQEFVEAIAHAERRRAKESLLLRAALAYAFPAHPSWAESDAAEALSKRETKAFNLAALSLTSPTLLLQGLELNGRFLTDGRALTLLLRFGPPIAELLVACALEPGVLQYSAVRLLAVVESVSVVRRLLELTRESYLRTSMLELLDRHPRQALLALLGEPPPRDVALKGRLRDWQELYPELAPQKKALAPPAKTTQPKAARTTGKATAASSELPRGVMRVLQEPVADLPLAGQQALAALAQALKCRESPLQPVRELAQQCAPGAARRVKAMVVAWGAAGEHTLALAGIEALGDAGHDFALGQLAALRDSASHRTLSNAAQSWLARTKLTEPELDDRKIDDFGLGAPLAVSLGKRTLRFEFGASLGFALRGNDGKQRTAFPPQRKDDEPERYALAKSMWERLRTEATPELRQQAKRLEAAMVDERKWTQAAFRGVLLNQPLLAYLARQLLWQASGGDKFELFRVAEDGSLADADDAPLMLGASAVIGLPHPLDIAADLARWGELFADYEISQPFEQLGREFVPADEPAATYAERLDGTVGPKAPFVLAGQGWEGENEGFSSDGWTGSKLLRGKQRLLWLTAIPERRFSFYLDFELDELDAIARSEVYRDLLKCGLRKEP